MTPIFGAIEAGGTKFVCMVGSGPDDILDIARFPTSTPTETLGRVLEFFRRPRQGVSLAAIGVASFGPIDLSPDSPHYGHITTTPKLPWQYTDVVGPLRAAFGVPVGWDTDVNGAALAEQRWGAGIGADPLVYITVGTGIGGGALVGGEPVHGMLHPEMGHLLVPSFAGDDFPGVCPFHGRCLEGVASGPALQARAGRPAQDLAHDDPIWELEATYLAYGILCMTEILAPKRVVVGGGVAEQPALIPAIRRQLLRLNNAYLAWMSEPGAIEAYVVAPGLGDRAGILGALELARRAYAAARHP